MGQVQWKGLMGQVQWKDSMAEFNGRIRWKGSMEGSDGGIPEGGVDSDEYTIVDLDTASVLSFEKLVVC